MNNLPPNLKRWSLLSSEFAGLSLFILAIGWTFVAASDAGSDPAPVAGLLLLAGAVFVVAAFVEKLLPGLIAAAVLASASVLIFLDPTEVFSSGPLSGPFGYSNAKGTFFVLAALAALMVAAGRFPIWVRVASGAAALGFAVIPFAVDSKMAAALVVVVPIVVGLIALWSVRGAVALCALAFVATLVATLTLGLTYRASLPTSISEAIEGSIRERRVVLWYDAIRMTVDHPVTGVGPGQFQFYSPTALSDDDAIWAHSEFLQQAAEQGSVGFALLVGIFMWGFARLFFHPDPDLKVALGAAALAALAIHGSLDYVIRFWPVAIAGAAIVGAASSRLIREDAEPDQWEGAEGDVVELIRP